MAGAPALLIAAQPDFGTAFLILLIFITVMLSARLKLKTLAVIVGLATVAAFPIYQHLLHDYQRKRVESFLNPNSQGAYQTRQALNAIGSGRFTGKGFLHGTQNSGCGTSRRCGPTFRSAVVARGVGLPGFAGGADSPTWC